MRRLREGPAPLSPPRRDGPDFVDAVCAPLEYAGPVRRPCAAISSEGKRATRASSAAWSRAACARTWPGRYDLISWVPLSQRAPGPARLRPGHAHRLATALELGDVAVETLRRTRNSEPQSMSGSAEKRRANISGAYEAVDPELVEGRRILLIDDIITTGSTISECARTLGLAGAESVAGAALALRTGGSLTKVPPACLKSRGNGRSTGERLLRMQILDRDIALDMGTAGVALYVKGKGHHQQAAHAGRGGQILREAAQRRRRGAEYAGAHPASIVPIRPIVGGAISDYDMTVAMLRELLHADVSRSLFKPRVLVCVPGSITGVEERAMIDAVTEAGARKVYLVESAVATGLRRRAGRLQARRPPDNRHRRRHHGDGGGLPGRRIRVREHKDSRRGL